MFPAGNMDNLMCGVQCGLNDYTSRVRSSSGYGKKISHLVFRY